MIRVCVLLLLLVASAVCAAEPEVDVDEVIRRGDCVTHTGDGIEAGEEGAIGASLALPPDDSNKWFVLVFTQRNCGPCEQLKRDWARSQHLQAWARPDDHKRSWAHYSEIRAEDSTQQWRLQRYNVTSFPTVIVQPPRSQEYGDPATVVLQRAGYDGNPEKLAAAMSSAIKDYVAKVFRNNQMQLAGGFRQAAGGFDPPFAPPPRVDPNYPFYPAGPSMMPMGPAFQIPPGPQPATLEQLKSCCPGADSDFLLAQVAANATVEQAQSAWRTEQTRRELLKLQEQAEKPKAKGPALASVSSSVMTLLLTLIGAGGFLGTVLMAAVLLLPLYRSYRKASGQPTLLTDPQFAAVIKELTEAAEMFKKNTRPGGNG